MSNQIPTVKIADPRKTGDFITINESDFDPAQHTLWDEPAIPFLGRKPTTEAVEIPADWREMKWFAMRALASNFAPAPANKLDAMSIIQSELARRG